MKKLILPIIVAVITLSGCGPMTPQDQMALQRAFQNMGQQMQLSQQQRMYDAQYNYYTRPYKVGNVTYVPSRQ